MATYNGMLVDDGENVGTRSHVYAGFNDDTVSFELIAARQPNVIPVTMLHPFHWDDNISVDQHGVRLATQFKGFIDDDNDKLNDLIAARPPMVYGGVIDDHTLLGSRQKKTISALMLRPLYWDDTVDVQDHGKRAPNQFVGFTDSGFGNNTPRRYPLELSWRSPLRQQYD